MLSLPSASALMGVGKFCRASKNGGIMPSSPWPRPDPGEMERMPTMMMGTIRASEASSSSFWPDLDDVGPFASTDMLGDSGAEEPNLNILKKLSGPLPEPAVPSSASLPFCLSAEAILPL